ncbi:MAG: DNA-processing protein DprA [Oscillospiraceae bacterium]
MSSENIFRDEIIKLLYLVSCFGVGKPRVWELVQQFGSLDALYKAIAFERPQGVFTPKELRAAKATTAKQLREIVAYCYGHNIGIVGFNDTDYPPRLRGIFNPPVLLFYKGEIDLLSADVIVSAVGARYPSEYSKNTAKKICSVLAESGIVVASGFAVGTDITAHLSAVRSGGKTIAVLGSGIGYEYPPENVRYIDEIAENGLFMSEYFPNTKANRLNFPARNRVLSGISMGTVVIEASEKSGSLNTASNAIAQGRDLWAVPPHDIFDPRYDGNKLLIRDGAIPLLYENDIPCEYFENYSHKPVKESISDTAMLDERVLDTFSNKKSSEPKRKKRSKHEEFPENESTYKAEGNAGIVYDIIKGAANGITPDEAAEKSGLDISEVLMLITDLEIDGAVYSETGQEYFAAE